MSNLNALYTELTTLADEDVSQENKPKEIDAGRHQLISNWKQSTVTREFMDKVDETIIALFEESISLAKGYPKHQNATKIVENLIRIDALRNVKNYV